jgi:hypothetical protein
MADSRRLRIFHTVQMRTGDPTRAPAGPAGNGFGIAARLGALLAALLVLDCGIRVAGGTSEVGNPSNAIMRDDGRDEDEDTASTQVGVRFDFTGAPIQIIKEKKPGKQTAADSASASSPATGTSSPAN